MKYMWFVFCVLVTGCTVVYNVDPPYVDPKKTTDYSLVFTSWKKSPKIWLRYVDGAWAKRDITGDPNAYQVTDRLHIVPGTRVITLDCAMPTGYQETTGWQYEIKIDLVKNEAYEVICEKNSDGAPIISIFNNGKMVPIQFIKSK
jgi:hypothetical protein